MKIFYSSNKVRSLNDISSRERSNNILIVILSVLALIILFTYANKALAAPVAYNTAGDENNLRTQEYYFPAILSKEEILAKIPDGVYPEDKVAFFPDPALRLGSKVMITRANVVDVADGRKSKRYRTFASAIGELFEEKEIELGDKDKVDPGLDAQISDKIKVQITRVKETQVEVKKSIPLEIVEKEDINLEKGKKVVKEEGQTGERKLIYLVRREDGEEVSRKLISDTVTKPMKKRVVVKGTKLPYIGSGVATWYGAPPLTAAHKTLPLGTMVLVTNTATGKSVKVRINDRGPQGAEIDLSRDAFEKIAPIGTGRANVKLEKWIE